MFYKRSRAPLWALVLWRWKDICIRKAGAEKNPREKHNPLFSKCHHGVQIHTNRSWLSPNISKWHGCGSVLPCYSLLIFCLLHWRRAQFLGCTGLKPDSTKKTWGEKNKIYHCSGSSQVPCVNTNDKLWTQARRHGSSEHLHPRPYYLKTFTKLRIPGTWQSTCQVRDGICLTASER